MTSRNLQTSRCPHCHQPTREALDADLLAITIHIDPQPITTAAELLAIAAGRHTYDITPTNGNDRIEPRETPHIHTTRRHPVAAQHACHTPPLPAATPPARPATPDTPPF